MEETLKTVDAHTARVKKVVEMEGTLNDVKRMVNDLVRKRKLRHVEAGGIIKQWKNRERRRVDRQVKKQINKACFHCREPGHMLADCPNKEIETERGGICYKCGSTEHSIYNCRRKNIKGFPFATCFVCNQEGHLSKDCGKNANGIYPDGGSCNVCNSTKHLRRDCPVFAAEKQQKEEKRFVIHTMSAMSSADDDYDPSQENKKLKLKDKQKIVKF